MSVSELLTEGGPIARSMEGFELRPQQLDMVRAIERAFADDRHLIVEAGTGVGKSFAYLLPGIQQSLDRDERIVISTHTIALQEQIVRRDLPFLASVYPRDFKAELVKGRSNYLGLRRLLKSAQQQHTLFEDSRLLELQQIQTWAHSTSDGSLATLGFMPSPALWDHVMSDSNDCRGRNCDHYKQCFFQRARRRIYDSQILVVNHALLMADLNLKRQ